MLCKKSTNAANLQTLSFLFNTEKSYKINVKFCSYIIYLFITTSLFNQISAAFSEVTMADNQIYNFVDV